MNQRKPPRTWRHDAGKGASVPSIDSFIGTSYRLWNTPRVRQNTDTFFKGKRDINSAKKRKKPYSSLRGYGPELMRAGEYRA